MSMEPMTARKPITWIIAMTEPGRELKAWDALRERGFTSFLPMETVWRNPRNKPRERVERPLFVGYMFVGVASWQSHAEVRAVHGVRGWVKNGRGDPAEVEQLFVYGLQADQCAGTFNRTPPAASDPKPDAPPKVTIDLAGPYSEDIKDILAADERGRIAMLLSGKFAVQIDVERAVFDEAA